MYKVFIKNAPVLFEDSGEKAQLFVNNKQVDFTVDIASLTEDNSVLFKGPLPETMHQVFADHKLIVAAGGVVLDKGELLFIERNGLWDLPKGKLEKGEGIEACAVREVEEECGIDGLGIVKELPSTFHTYELKGKKVLKRTYWYEMHIANRQEMKPQLEEGITRVEWMGIEQFDSQRLETYASINTLLDYFRPR